MTCFDSGVLTPPPWGKIVLAIVILVAVSVALNRFYNCVRQRARPAHLKEGALDDIGEDELDIDKVKVTKIRLSGAGTNLANGLYKLKPGLEKGNRPCYVNPLQPDRFIIQWSTQSSCWMMDDVYGAAPYKIAGGRDDKLFPVDGEWEDYQGGEEPPPQTVDWDCDVE